LRKRVCVDFYRLALNAVPGSRPVVHLLVNDREQFEPKHWHTVAWAAEALEMAAMFLDVHSSSFTRLKETSCDRKTTDYN
jgi:hypothetical protein